MVVKQLLLGAGLPALVAIAVLLVAGRFLKRPRSASNASVGALALGAGFVTGQLSLFGWPGFAPEESWEWLSHVAVAATAAGMLVTSARIPRGARWGIAGLVAIGTAYLLVPHWQESRVAWIVALASVTISLWIAMHVLADRDSFAPASLIVLISALAAAVVLERAATARFAQLAGVLVATAGGCLVVAPLVSGSKLGPGLAGTAAVLLVGLMFTGHFSHVSDIPAICFFLVMAAPLMAWVGQWGPIRRRTSWQRLVIEFAAVLVPGAVAVGLAFAATNSSG